MNIDFSKTYSAAQVVKIIDRELKKYPNDPVLVSRRKEISEGNENLLFWVVCNKTEFHAIVAA